MSSSSGWIPVHHSSTQIAIGNPAGDADSVVSALGWAYATTQQEASHITPVVSIARQDLLTQRPETMALFRLADVDVHALICRDELEEELPPPPYQITLLDHNHESTGLDGTVVSILDHHVDEGQHPEATRRTIAFVDDRALVASTCTLVAEALYDRPSIPSSLALLLLGVILLDSINLSETAGKVTDRDRKAVQWLSQYTPADYQTTAQHTQLFERLQSAKFDPDFWASLSVYDALRLDYKDFGGGWGLSSVALWKTQVDDDVVRFMNDKTLDFLGVLWAQPQEDGSLRRELIWCANKSVWSDSQLDALYEHCNRQDLQLKLLCESTTHPTLTLRHYSQANVQASRKQVAPILSDFVSTAVGVRQCPN